MAGEMHGDTCFICVGKMEDVAIVELAGEVDVATVSLLGKALRDTLRTSDGPVILDARKLTYIDSTGLQTLMSAHRKLVETGRSLAIVGCHGVFYKLLSIARLARHFPMYATVEEAFASLDRPNAST